MMNNGIKLEIGARVSSIGNRNGNSIMDRLSNKEESSQRANLQAKGLGIGRLGLAPKRNNDREKTQSSIQIQCNLSQGEGNTSFI